MNVPAVAVVVGAVVGILVLLLEGLAYLRRWTRIRVNEFNCWAERDSQRLTWHAFVRLTWARGDDPGRLQRLRVLPAWLLRRQLAKYLHNGRQLALAWDCGADLQRGKPHNEQRIFYFRLSDHYKDLLRCYKDLRLNNLETLLFVETARDVIRRGAAKEVVSAYLAVERPGQLIGLLKRDRKLVWEFAGGLRGSWPRNAVLLEARTAWDLTRIFLAQTSLWFLWRIYYRPLRIMQARFKA